MHRIYQSTQRILAAQIVAIDLLPQPKEADGAVVLAVRVEGGDTFNVPASWAAENGVQVGGYLGLAGVNGQGQAYFIPADRFSVDFAHVGDLPPPADAAGAPESVSYAIDNVPASYTFEQFIEYGINTGAPVLPGNAMPWSFTFHGRAVTHENDDCYLISTKAGKQMAFRRGEAIAVDGDGMLSIAPAKPAAYEPSVDDRAGHAQGGA